MSAYRPYPKYKPSGVEWLGDVPETWKASRIGRLSSTGMGQTILREMLEDVPSADALPVYSASEAEAEFGYFMNPSVRLTSGDLVVGARGSIGLTRRISAPSTCTQTTIWVKPIRSQIDNAYLYWCMIGGREQLFPFDKTAIPMLTVEQVRSGGIPLPPLPEQHQIASFLDRECGKLDALQAKQERLIELLKEKRQALISHAVTRGLDPTAKLKPSGIEWLGDVPEHWVVSRVKFVLVNEDRRRIPLSSEERSFKQGEYPYYGASGIIDSVDEFIFNGDRILVGEDGANLVNRATPLAFVASGKYWVNNHAHILRAPDDLSAFWAQLIETNDISPIVSGSAQPKLTSENLANLPIWFPPSREEREKIVAHLDEKCGKIDQLKAKAERGIELLKERRSALISAAVTGKIDVRNE